jgi:hypothetical protein
MEGIVIGEKQTLLGEIGVDGPDDLTIIGKPHFGFHILWEQTDDMDSFSLIVG